MPRQIQDSKKWMLPLIKDPYNYLIIDTEATCIGISCLVIHVFMSFMLAQHDDYKLIAFFDCCYLPCFFCTWFHVFSYIFHFFPLQLLISYGDNGTKGALKDKHVLRSAKCQVCIPCVDSVRLSNLIVLIFLVIMISRKICKHYETRMLVVT